MAPLPKDDTNTTHRDGPLALAIVGLVAATVLIATLAPGVDGAASKAASSRLAPADDPSCAEWSDGCRVCQRLAEGTACSMPGIACTQTESECRRHE